jgi:histidinol-phosphate aminotransferase
MPRPKENSTDDLLRLSSNESPLNLSKSAQKAIVDHLPFGHRYPGKWRALFAEQLAGALGVSEENLILGAGSTEILQASVLTSTSAGQPLIVADPSFEEVPDYQQALSRRVIRVPLTANFSHDLDRMRDVVERENYHATVYICNPNSPTGTLTPSSAIDCWIEEAPETVRFIVDEAYFEFVEEPSYWSVLKWIESKPNVIVTRTFSKIYGMAGLRVGYGIAHPETAARLHPLVSYESNTVLALVAGMASLRDRAHVEHMLAVNKASLEVVHQTLDSLGLRYLPSHTNFLMHEISGDPDLYIQRFREQGIAVGRPFSPMTGYNRVTLSTPEHMTRWADVLRGFRTKGWI